MWTVPLPDREGGVDCPRQGKGCGLSQTGDGVWTVSDRVGV